MKSLKHIGRLKNTGSKVLVAFRTLPGESDQALILPVSNLTPENHDSLMNLLETPQAQEAYELGEIMFIRTFSDGRPMLSACQADRSMYKIATDQVIMTPNTRDEIPLSDLNVLIAEQKNCAIDDLYTFVKGAVKVENAATVKDMGKELGEPNVPEYDDTDNDAVKTSSATTTPELAELQPTDPNAILSDADIAKGYRSQADAMFKEAQRLRKEAEELDPKAKKSTAKKSTTSKSKAKSTKAEKVSE